MLIISVTEVIYKGIGIETLMSGFRSGGASLISGGLSEIHTSALLLTIILLPNLKDFQSAHLAKKIKILSLLFIPGIISSSRSALVMAFVGLIIMVTNNIKFKYSKISVVTTLLVASAVLYYLVNNFDYVIESTRFIEIFDWSKGEGQAIQSKLAKVGAWITLGDSLQNIFVGKLFLMDSTYSESIITVIQIIVLILLSPLNYLLWFGFIGVLSQVLLSRWLCLLNIASLKIAIYVWLALICAAFTGAGLLQDFDGTLGKTIYFDGLILASAILRYIPEIYNSSNRYKYLACKKT